MKRIYILQQKRPLALFNGVVSKIHLDHCCVIVETWVTWQTICPFF